MRIAITGAAGQLGRLVIDGLKARTYAASLVALARSPEKAADLGIEARPFDYDAPAGLAPALEGVDVLLLISGSEIGKRGPQHRAVIEAAKAAGVGHVVYTSLLHADESVISLAPEHRETEADLAASGLPHTILRNGWYAENYTAGLPAALEHGALIGAAGHGRIAAAARADYAAAAVAVLLDPAQQGKVHELAGDVAWTLADLAAELSAQSGKEIPYVDMPEAEYAKALEGAGLPAGLAAFIAGADAAAAQGALFDDGGALSALIGRPTTPLSASVAAAIG
ncbi:SDR family oxidoreductase [Rhodovulum sp. DZ06]|uniref:SDR family oxidoreductase n=1 Tax=Rhodovulum sp. DZ06 TaxID=3425126 RepID=UPI003D3413BE